jgi:hypothetical protein
MCLNSIGAGHQVPDYVVLIITSRRLFHIRAPGKDPDISHITSSTERPPDQPGIRTMRADIAGNNLKFIFEVIISSTQG